MLRTAASAATLAYPYDRLYEAARGRLWRDAPGRLVEVAARRAVPGRALDLGCGDGRNSLFLESRGWTVDAYDVSPVAIREAHLRYEEGGREPRGCLTVGAAEVVDAAPRAYDLVLVYGLYHCLDESQLVRVHRTALTALRAGGLIAFSALDDRLPVPRGHGTMPLRLRSRSELKALFHPLQQVDWIEGYIEESHEPVVGLHRHAAVWGLWTAMS